jgi:hypothetical protein
MVRLAKGLRWGLAAGVLALASILLHAPAPLSVASSQLEARKQPMRFSWHECKPDCGGWVSALGIVTSETPALFDEFAKLESTRGRDLTGVSIVLDSSGGSVNDAITLGRRFRQIKALTSVGVTLEARGNERASISDSAYCESMCVFLLLAGQTRYVPDGARVRVHQIWMGDRADDPRGASYSAQDLMIVERDIGRLAKFTFDMGGTGDLLSLALSIPPWDDLHEMTPGEMQAANLFTTRNRPDVLARAMRSPAVAMGPKLLQDRFAGDMQSAEIIALPDKPTKTADATGGHAPMEK